MSAPRWSATGIAEALGRPRPTPERIAVIEAPLDPLLVVAGAGSGKTETMAARVVWLIANELAAPHAVLGLTFRRKAAGDACSSAGPLSQHSAGTLPPRSSTSAGVPRPSRTQLSPRSSDSTRRGTPTPVSSCSPHSDR